MIIKNAAYLFSERGYYGVGLTELLSICEIPKGSFYYYFPKGKIQLIKEVLDASYIQMKTGIENSHFKNEDDPLKAFEKMADFLADNVEKRSFFSSLLLTMISIESVYLDDEVNQTCKRIYTEWQELYAQKFLDFGYSKKESYEKAQAVFALIHGSMISSWIKKDSSDLKMIKKSLIHIINR
ncbi:MAG: TetR/AcrR family transcriptional regulator [Anaerorhabdus sp.]